MSRRLRRGFGRLAALDRRWLYLALLVSVAAAMITGVRFPDRPSVLVRPIYEHIEALPAGRPLLLSCDYSPSTAPELQPMAVAVTRHALLTGHPVVFVSLWPEGNALIERVVDEAVRPDFPDAVPGRDWVVMGYKAGREMMINTLVRDFRAFYAQDVRGAPIDSLPALDGIDGLEDFGLVVGLASGVPGLREWILFGGDVTGAPVAGGVTGTGAPRFFAYYPQQLLGLMAGMKGAAEYEAALERGHPEFRQRTMRGGDNMGPLSVAHLVIILFILMGNAGLLLGRRREGEGRG